MAEGWLTVWKEIAAYTVNIILKKEIISLERH